MQSLTAEQIILIHNSVINSHELQGLAPDKSIHAAIARIANRLAYSLIEDIFVLAACYAEVIAVAHVFNDANKRTAFAAMDTILAINGIELIYPSEIEAGNWIRNIVLKQKTEAELANWLRELAHS